MLRIVFEPDAWDELGWWANNQPKMVKRIHAVLESAAKSPFVGVGKPEPLRSNWSGYWSRRITDEHRIVYKVETDRLIVIQLKGHY